jgi:hypothetical protein
VEKKKKLHYQEDALPNGRGQRDILAFRFFLDKVELLNIGRNQMNLI